MARVIADVNIIEHSSTLINKFKSPKDTLSDYPTHQLQEDQGIYWIVIDNDVIYNSINSYFEQIRQPNGDIHLRLVNIFANNSKNRSSRLEALPTQLDDQDYGE